MNRTKNLLCLLLGLSLLFVWGCTKKEKEAKKEPVLTPVAQKKNLKPKPVNENKMPGKWQSFFESVSDLEKYDSSDAACRTYCKQWCPKAVRCNVDLISRPNGCKRYCYAPCRRGQVPKVLAECLMNAAICPDVKTCFASLSEKTKPGDKKDIQSKITVKVEKKTKTENGEKQGDEPTK